MKQLKSISAGLLLLLLLLLAALFIHMRDTIPVRAVGSGILLKDPIWAFSTQDAIAATPVGDGSGRVFVRMANSIVALDVRSGKQLWQASSPGRTAALLARQPSLIVAPVTYGNYLVVPERDSGLATFSTDTGRLIWRAPSPNPGLTHAAAIDIQVLSVSDDVAYVARFDAGLSAYDIADGGIIWEQDISGRSNPYLVLDDDAVYLGAGTLLRAYDKRTGAPLWQEEVASYIGPMLLNDEILYIIDEKDASLLAVDVSSKDTKWRVSLNGMEAFGIECIAQWKDELFIAGTRLSAVSSVNGQLLWQTAVMGHLECPVVLANDLYIRNIGSTLFALDIASGTDIGTLNVEVNTSMKNEPDRSPLSMDGMLIVPISDHRIVAYGSQ